MWCEYPGCAQTGHQVHHPFGRVGEPWASSRLVCLLLCADHHERVTVLNSKAHRADRDALRQLALMRMSNWLHDQLPQQTIYPYVAGEDLRQHFGYLKNVATVYRLLPPGYTEGGVG